MVLVEAPILAGRVACASSDLVQVAGISPRVLERTSRICAPRPEFSVPVRQTRRPTCRAAFVSRHIRGVLRPESARTISAARIGGMYSGIGGRIDVEVKDPAGHPRRVTRNRFVELEHRCHRVHCG